MATSVWAELVGQERVVEVLQDAVAGQMTHAWLFTGPPGSGRSNAALAFAAALQCEAGGCGSCHSCVTAAAGSHPDIAVINTSGLSIGVEAARDAVRRSALHPSSGKYQILVVEDADRLTEQAANALLKSIEEPAPATVWLLCAPAVEDVLMTIRSRCRPVLLRTPPITAVAELLTVRDGLDPQVAKAAAAAAQGHIGRARALAKDEHARARRAEILALAINLRSLGDCLTAAKSIDAEATARAKVRCDVLDAKESEALAQSWGVEERGRRPAGYAGALSALSKEQDRRRKRMARDSIDGVLLDLLSLQRDVLAVQLATGAEPINTEAGAGISALAEQRSVELTLGAIDAIMECRSALEANAAPLLALELMMTRFLP